MSPYFRPRPDKQPFSLPEQERLRTLAVQAVRRLLLPDDCVVKIVLIGSSVKGTFGEYAPPGFKGSLFSDFDFIVYVDSRYAVPANLERVPDGKPFQDDSLNHAYRVRNFVEGRYDAEIFFVFAASLADASIRQEGEDAGIPMDLATTSNPFMVVWP